MTNDMKVQDYFIRKLRQSAIQPTNTVPLLSKKLKGYVLNGRHTGIASARHQAGIDQFTEVKGRHRDDPSGAAAVNKLQSQVKGHYITQLKRKDQQLFITMDRGPLETVLNQIEFKPLVFGSFG
jgi:hypothetical protein